MIVLLSKKPDAAELGDYRPITMIHSLAKIVSKALAQRLTSRVDELISANQNAFIHGRMIHDNFKYVLWTFVLIRKKVPQVLLMLDISKAFDTAVWPFLLDVL